jgi:mono/diheme cytochrome c family protein
MNKRTLAGGRSVVILALALLTTLAGPGTVLGQDRGSMAEGARIYGDVCGSCHNARSPLERDDRDWVTIMNHMRIRANMTGQQVQDVLAFLQATNADPRQAVPVATAETDLGERVDGIAEGRRLVEQKACLGCHVIGDGGANVGPRLNEVVAAKGRDFVVRKIADPTFNNNTSMMPNLGLSEEQLGWVADYLATLSDN